MHCLWVIYFEPLSNIHLRYLYIVGGLSGLVSGPLFEPKTRQKQTVKATHFFKQRVQKTGTIQKVMMDQEPINCSYKMASPMIQTIIDHCTFDLFGKH